MTMFFFINKTLISLGQTNLQDHRYDGLILRDQPKCLVMESPIEVRAKFCMNRSNTKC